MNDYFRGFYQGIILCLVITGVYLIKTNFQYSEAHYAALERKIEALRGEYGR